MSSILIDVVRTDSSTVDAQLLLGIRGEKGEKGNTGDSGVHVGTTEPTDPVKNVWIDPSDGDNSVLKLKSGSEWEQIDSIKGDKGDTGDPAGFGEVTATVDASHGTPSVTVTASGEDTAKNFAFAFSNLQPAPYDDSAIQARMDSFTSLEEGSTTGDAELIDGRVGADGVTYTNIGGAIRGQVSDLRNELISYNAVNLLDYFASYISRTSAGVTYTWESNNKKCTVSGISTGVSFTNIFNNSSALPNGLTAGGKYRVFFDSTDTHIAVEFLFYLDNATSSPTSLRIRQSGDVEIPTNCTGLGIRLRVLSGESVDGYIKDIEFFSTYTNKELSEFADNTMWATNPNAHMFSVCNSILTGSVWINGSMDHLSDYENAPYGNVAISLGVPKKNVNHMLLSNTGLMHDAGEGSFLDVIKATDLSIYDYLLTHLWTADMYRNRKLGSVKSTADDGTIAGTVISLVTYAKNSNSQCKVILVSIPPVRGGDDVFSAVYGNGSSIKELDALMHKLARIYHFVYIDWQSLALSYCYQDYTDGDNVHANNEDTYRSMGEYLGINIHSEDVDEVVTKAEGEFDVISQRDAIIEDKTTHGITFTWNANRECAITGTATQRAVNNLYYNQTALPNNLAVNDRLLIRFKQEQIQGVVGFEAIFYDAEATVINTFKYTGDALLAIPADAVGMAMRLYVNENVTVDAVVTRIQVIKVNFKKPDKPLIISFIDDDTSGQDYVEKYHAACKHNGVKGNYAVMTYHIDRDVSAETLLGYEDEGFGMLTHCYYQSGSNTPYWSDDNRVESVVNQCRANIARGLREMRNYGFVSYNHFVVPGGHTYPDIFEMSRQLGFETAISTANRTWNTFADYDRTFIKRVSFEKDDSNSSRTMQATKDIIDACVSDGCGWLILTTHFNEWGSIAWDETLDANGNPVGYSRFNEIVQYAINAGMTPMNYCEAWSHFKSLFDANRQIYDSINGQH